MKKQANCLRCLKYQEIGAKRHSQITGSLPYAPKGTAIRIEASHRGIWVENEAIDLDPQAIEHVFEPFWRSEDGLDEQSKLHAGLGLNLCRRIAELLGGHIAAKLKEPGPVFQVQLTFGT
jgi:K+-sensing histidine kinase KdpD